MAAASYLLFVRIANCILLSKSMNIGFLIEERFFNMADNSSVFPEFCLTKLPETLGIQLIVRKYHPQKPEDVHYYVNELVSKDCLVVISYVSCEMQELIQVYLTIHGRPHIPLPDTHCFRANGNTRSSPVRMRPKTNLLMQAIVSLIAYLRWTETNILMDGSFHYHQEISVMAGLSKKGVRFTLHRLNYTKATFESELKRYKPRIASTFFLVLMDREGTMKTLKAASQVNLIRYNTQWIIGNLDVNDADFQGIHVDQNQVNIAAFKQPCVDFLKIDPKHDQSIITIMELAILQRFLTFLNRCLSDFKSEKEFLKRKPNSTQKSLKSVGSSPRKDSGPRRQFSVLLENDTVDHYTIVRIESRWKEHLEFLQVAEWCARNDEITKIDKKFFPNARPGFGNRVLKVAFNEMKPYISRIKDSDPPQYVGFNVDILKQLSVNLNFRYDLIETPDQLFGTLNKTSGEWRGVIGMAARNEVALGIGPLTLTYDRFMVVDYTQPYMEDGMGILMKRPNGKPADLLQSYRVFAESTWIALSVSFVISFVLLTVVNRGSSYVRGKNKVPKPSRTYKYNFWLMFGYSLQEGSGIEPVNTPGRIIVGFWWLFIILVSTNYTANLAAFLTVPINPIEIQNLHDLANDDKLTPITIYESDNYQFFQTSTDEDYKIMGSRMESGPHFKYEGPILTLVDSHDYAFVTDMSFCSYLASKRCGFYLVITDPAYKQSLGFVLPKGSPYRDKVSSSIVAMQEAGLIDKMKKRWWNSSIACAAPSEEKHMQASGLKMDTIGGAFIIYICVAILGILCVILELIFVRIQKRRNKNHRQASSSAATDT